MNQRDSPAPTSSAAVSQRRTVSRAGAPITLERLTLSRPLRDAIARQFTRPHDTRPAPTPGR
ncbi:hypothetical protein TBR22_A00170 [Luteitalea sp. TBR-22]|uniref:hypothetical protein n=1 Tax=Luteitalea sp. TBR-22 TaxID=2802971 RepID=UPI001AFB0F26|nr:hypothetical protein [Luteitalea sp. TBR-22]BCS30817.1 hypothetical protein TBR22_A00170 [Luteitalea sp. TBR-22]